MFVLRILAKLPPTKRRLRDEVWQATMGDVDRIIQLIFCRSGQPVCSDIDAL